jgi:small subunit ribosomal protein S3Ae
MAPKKKKIVQAKVKKKKWYPILAPKLFNHVALGESYVADSSLLEGKYISANLSTIAGNMRKQNVNMHFRVIKVGDGKADTEVIGYSLITAAVKRLVKRGRDKVTDSFLAKTSDKKVLRIKPIIITHTHATKSIQSALRLETRRVIREFAFTKSVEDLISSVADGKLQKLVKESAGKIYPLRSIDINSVRIVENDRIVVTDDAVVSEKVTIRKKDKGESYGVKSEDEESKVEQDDEQELSEDELEEFEDESEKIIADESKTAGDDESEDLDDVEDEDAAKEDDDVKSVKDSSKDAADSESKKNA